jgi:hypothetical protein
MRLLVIFLLVFLISCGGGGGGSSGGTSVDTTLESRPIPTTLIKDDIPSELTTMSGFDYLPLTPGSSYRYVDISQPGQADNIVVTEITSSPTDDSLRIVLDYPGGGSISNTSAAYRRAANGWRFSVLDSDAPNILRNAIESIVYLPEKIYAPRQLRKSIRQGSLGEDLDGDSKPDGFQLIFEQIFRGTQTISLYGNTVSVAVFDTTLTQSITPSSLEFSTVSTTLFQREYFQLHIGLIKSIGKADSEPEKSMQLYDAKVDGLLWRDQLFADGRVITISVEYPRQVLFASSHNKYYAIEGAPTRFEAVSSIAIIDPVTGAVTRKSLRAMPSKLAISADQSVMYVGFLNSSDILKLSLPSLSEMVTYTFALPLSSLSQRPHSESIAVDPTDSNKFAVKFTTGASPGAIGVYLVSNGIVQSIFNESSSTSTYPADSLVANTIFFGKSNEILTSGSEILATEVLTRLQISGSTITKTHSRDSSNDSGFHYFSGLRQPAVLGNNFIIRKSLYSTNELSFSRTLPGDECIFLSNDYIGCTTLTSNNTMSLNVVNIISNDIVSTVRLFEYADAILQMTKGPLGQLALVHKNGGELKLINAPSLIP